VFLAIVFPFDCFVMVVSSGEYGGAMSNVDAPFDFLSRKANRNRTTVLQ
jgi:hypothetical protein